MTDENALARKAENPSGSGCLVCVVALIGSIVWAVLQPVFGGPAIVLVVATGVLYIRWLSRREEQMQARRLGELHRIAAPSGDAWRRLFERRELGHLVPHVEPLVRRAIRIETRGDSAQVVGGSRLGGSPDLPDGVEWPSCRDRPLPFLAQISLAEVHAADPTSILPKEGYLWFFLDFGHWGTSEGSQGSPGRVLHGPGHETLVRRAHPGGEAFTACTVVFDAYDDIPELVSAVPELAALDDIRADRYWELRAYLASGGEGCQHKLLGWANSVQHDVESEPGLGDDIRLLLQLDSDDDADMMWGDLGKIYFLIPSRDSRAARFDAVRVVAQFT